MLPPAKARSANSSSGSIGSLRRYLAAFETSDTQLLAELLRADVVYEMPPIARWFRGRAAVLDHHARRVFAHHRRALLTSANGYPALAMYTADDAGSYHAHGIHLIEQVDGSIARIVVFLNAELFPRFELPVTIPRW
jgi:RNA polymerase sigma-70 factor (ECF subfamily)